MKVYAVDIKVSCSTLTTISYSLRSKTKIDTQPIHLTKPRFQEEVGFIQYTVHILLGLQGLF